MKSSLKFDHSKIKAGEETSLYLLVKVTGPKGDQKRERLPLNLSVVIDRSGSMSGAKLQYVKMAAQELVRGLGEKDRLSLVSYGHDVTVELEPRLVENRSVFRRAIDGIQIHGNTFLSGGWMQGCELVSSALQERGLNRVLLLTDGLANEGVTNPDLLTAMARQQREQGVTTTTFGVGMGYNEDLLARLANEGGGAFYFIDNPDQAEALFKEELKDLSNVVGQHLEIWLETDSAVRSVKQLFEYRRSEEGGALVYQLGDLYAQEDRCQLFEFKLRELDPGEIQLGQVTISCDAILGEKIKKIKRVRKIAVQVVPREEFKKRRPNKEVIRLVLLQEVRSARKEALRFADLREFIKARDILQAVAERIQASGLKDEELLNEYDRLLEEAKDMEFGKERYDTHSRKVSTYMMASAPRSARYDSIKTDLHLRHKMSQSARESGGDIPGRIAWRGGEARLWGREMRVGTEPENEISLADPEVDLVHCRLLQRERIWYLENFSTRGTLANGGLVSGRFRLSVGDVIRVGNTVLRLLVDDRRDHVDPDH